MLEEVARYQIWIAPAEPIVMMLLSSFERALTKTSGGCWRMRDVRSRQNEDIRGGTKDLFGC
jgi:hypothetical protein